MNASKVLPETLLKELQRYVNGEIIYVPGNGSSKAGWGEANGTKEKYMERNSEIIMLYRNGSSKEEIAEKYHLSEYSIKKILNGVGNLRKQNV
jgi:Mor family transcriptional regulator